jgi:hypothetical protein
VQFLKRGYAEVEVDGSFGKFAEFVLYKGKVTKGKPRVLRGIPFDLVFGDPSTAAIYRVVEPKTKEYAGTIRRYDAKSQTEPVNEPPSTVIKQELDTSDDPEDNTGKTRIFSIQEVKKVFQAKQIQPTALLDHLSGMKNDTANPLDHDRLKSLRAFATVTRLYREFHGASIALDVTSKPLHLAKWLPQGAADSRRGRGNFEADTSVSGSDDRAVARTETSISPANNPGENSQSTSL